MRKIFEAAGVKMSVRLEGRSRLTPEATFHSLRHTFVSISANAGVPLHIVQSIVGHESTAMTRHYYHENLDALRKAVAAIPSFGGVKSQDVVSQSVVLSGEKSGFVSHKNVEDRLRKLDKLARKGIISSDELKLHRTRILSEL